MNKTAGTVLRIVCLASCLLWTLLSIGGVQAGQVRLAAGNGIWLIPSRTPVSDPAPLIANLKAHNIKHVFLWTADSPNTPYAAYAPLIEQAHAQGLTVHAACAVTTTVTDPNNQLSPVLLANALNQVFSYNSNYPAAPFDGVQMDVEGVSGASLLQLVSQVHVPTNLVFSAAIQPDEFYPNVEPYYAALLTNTDLDVLIPMIYIMDGIHYSNGNLQHTFTISGNNNIASKTAEMLSRLPANGQMMTGLSAYDYEFAVSKGGGIDNSVPGSRGSATAFSSSPYAVPGSAATLPLVDVFYQTNSGVSCYRFNYDSNHWWDVNEMTPIGLGLSINAAEQGANGNPRYVGSCTWVYRTVFDATSERQAGLTLDNTNHPMPQVSLQVVSVLGDVVRVRVSLTNTNPAEQILGDKASAGVYLRLQGAWFVSAEAGSFHAAEAFEATGKPLANTNGASILELRRYFFENLASQQAQSGDITIQAAGPFTLSYRAWMTAKDSLCSNADGQPEPYIARSPDDIHYRDLARFLSYATFTTNIIVPPTPVTLPAGDRPKDSAKQAVSRQSFSPADD